MVQNVKTSLLLMTERVEAHPVFNFESASL